ncbi:hypothetical protein SGRIM128S_03583 [Streptomyces griseomycini]
MDRRRRRCAPPRWHRRVGVGRAGRRNAPPHAVGLGRSVPADPEPPAVLDARTTDVEHGTADADTDRHGTADADADRHSAADADAHAVARADDGPSPSFGTAGPPADTPPADGRRGQRSRGRARPPWSRGRRTSCTTPTSRFRSARPCTPGCRGESAGAGDGVQLAEVGACAASSPRAPRAFCEAAGELLHGGRRCRRRGSRASAGLIPAVGGRGGEGIPARPAGRRPGDRGGGIEGQGDGGRGAARAGPGAPGRPAVGPLRGPPCRCREEGRGPEQGDTAGARPAGRVTRSCRRCRSG